MKYLLIIAALTTVVGCASKDKKEESKTETAAVEQSAEESEASKEQPEAAQEDAPAPQTEEPKTETVETPDAAAATASTEEQTQDAPQGGSFSAVEGEVTLSHECQSNKDTRVIRVNRAEGQKPLCGVAYEKFGQTTTVAIASSDESHCSQVANQIQQNLASAGFQCNSSGQPAAEAQTTTEQSEEDSEKEEQAEQPEVKQAEPTSTKGKKG